MLDQAIVMLDFETTGLSPAMGDRITEVAALRIVEGVVAERFVTLIDCGVRIPPMITALTGITQAMVDGAPPVREVLPALLDFIGEDALAAHNASFDSRFLLAESQRLGLQPRHRHTLCSLKLARRLLPGQPSYTLGHLARSLQLSFNGRAHRAEADAEVSAQLLLQLARRVRRDYPLAALSPAVLELLCRQSAAKVGDFLRRQLAVA